MKDSEQQTLQEEEIMMDEKKPNVQQELYSIGEVSRICNVSKKALRFMTRSTSYRRIISVRKTNTGTITGRRCF